MADDRDEMRAALAALAIGRLGDGERTGLQSLVDGNPSLAQTLADLRATATLAKRADPDRVVSDPVHTPQGLRERILAVVARERAFRRRRRRIAAAASTAAVVAVVAVALVISGLVTRSDDDGRHLFATAPAGVTASYSLEPGPGGTRIELTLAGLDDGRLYRVWLSDENAAREIAGSFRAGTGVERMTFTAAMAYADAARLWVTNEEEDIILDEQLPRAD